MKKNVLITLIIVSLVGAMCFMSSCRKPACPKAVVSVVDASNNPVEGAMVIVKAKNSDSSHTMVYLKDETKSVADTQYTGADGIINYEFKYECILNVEVTKSADKKNPVVRRGMGVLVLENNKTTEVTIEVNEQTVFN